MEMQRREPARRDQIGMRNPRRIGRRQRAGGPDHEIRPPMPPTIGGFRAPPAASTPGTAATASGQTMNERRPLRRRHRRRRDADDQCATRIEPEWHVARRSKVCTNRPAATTEQERDRDVEDDNAADTAARPVATECPCDRSHRSVPTLVARSAGAAPKSSAVATAAPTANPRTRPSTAVSSAMGERAVRQVRQQHACRPRGEQQSDRGAIDASTTLSARSCRASRQREAPSATRTLSS